MAKHSSFAAIRDSTGEPILKVGLREIGATAAALVSGVGVSRFLRRYLGDVQFWCTYEETDSKHTKRSEILKRSLGVLEHVLRDENCSRLIVVGHSLGSAIALETLFEAGRYNRARELQFPMERPLQLSKLEALVTMGSPIDKIHYFFESYPSTHHRFVRTIEGLRGDMATIPFAAQRKPQMHWLNIWDEGDPISGPLNSPAGAVSPEFQVENIETRQYWYPNPSRCHSGYFESTHVMEVLYGIIFSGAFSQATRLITNGDASLLRSHSWPAAQRTVTRFFQILAILLPWLILGALMSYAEFGAGSPVYLVLRCMAVMCIGSTLLGLAVGSRIPHIASLHRTAARLPTDDVPPRNSAI